MKRSQLITLKAIGQSPATLVVAGCEEAQQGHQQCFAVTDTAGHLISFHRMDGCAVVSIDVAIGKARTAAYLGAPSKLFEDLINSGAPSMLSAPGLVPLQGGLPVVIDGSVVGAIGVSGATGEEDVAVAVAALAAVGAEVGQQISSLGTILVCGYGPGISDSVAKKWGEAGYAVALVARNEARLQDGVNQLQAAGVNAAAFACDLGDVDAVTDTVTAVRDQVGPISVLHWNAFRGGAGPLRTAKVENLRAGIDVSYLGFLAAVQSALPDLQDAKGAILVTGGGFGLDGDASNQLVAKIGASGDGIAKGLLHRAAGLLHYELAEDGIFVGEVMVTSLVKGTAFDPGDGSANLNADDIADEFWRLSEERSTPFVRV